MAENQEQAQKNYNQMNASEKTAYLGFKHFSDREVNERTKAAAERRSKVFAEFLKRLSTIKDIPVGNSHEPKVLEEAYSAPVNEFYSWIVSEGYTANDLKAVADWFLFLNELMLRSHRQFGIEETKFNYGLTGENDLGDLPIKKVMDIAQMALETRPAEPVIEDEGDKFAPEPEETA